VPAGGASDVAGAYSAAYIAASRPLSVVSLLHAVVQWLNFWKDKLWRIVKHVLNYLYSFMLCKWGTEENLTCAVQLQFILYK
jgi:hypothetical protein